MRKGIVYIYTYLFRIWLNRRYLGSHTASVLRQ